MIKTPKVVRWPWTEPSRLAAQLPALLVPAERVLTETWRDASALCDATAPTRVQAVEQLVLSEEAARGSDCTGRQAGGSLGVDDD